MAKHYYYFTDKVTALKFMESVPKDKQEDIKVCFPVDVNLSSKSSTRSIPEELLKTLFKEPDRTLTKERANEVIEEIGDLIKKWPQLRLQ